MMVNPATPEELRAQADRLEAEAEAAKIRAYGYFCGYVWSRGGKCSEEWLVDAKCSNHTEPYTDEYDYGVKFCPKCNKRDGIIKVARWIRAPQYDAPTPPEGKPA